MAYTSSLSLAMSFLILLSNIFFIGVVLLYIFSQKTRLYIENNVGQYAVVYIFILSFLSTAGSLIMSNVIGFAPCELCWFQRIFMYPQVVIALVALFRQEKRIVYYLFPLSVLGGLLALYHSFILWGGKSFISCTQAGSACAKIYVLDFHYITIPFMSLSMFVYLLAVSWVYFRAIRSDNKNKENVTV